MNLAHWYTSEISVTVFYFMARSPAGLSSLVRKTINCPQFVLDSDSNLVVSWLVGGRDSGYAMELMDDLAKKAAGEPGPAQFLPHSQITESRPSYGRRPD